uniref:Uncharacterized protein n=1 Tax=viral metagenome TaxID=1070528 RepID=A0A6C0BY29_9ZZZZ
MSDTSIAENELIRGYNLINKATNYTKVGCKKKILHSADEYNNMLQNLADEYLSILEEYTKDYPTYKMDLYEEDFFSGKGTKYFTELTKKVAKDEKEWEASPTARRWEAESINKSFNFTDAQNTELQGIYNRVVMPMMKKMSNDMYELRNLKEKYAKNEQIAKNEWLSLLGSDRQGIITNMESIETRLYDIQNELFTIKHMIETDVNTMQDCILTVSKDIDLLQVENSKLERKINSLQGRKAGAVGQVYDSQLLYNEYYLGNIIISIIVIVLLYKYLALYITDITNKVDTKFIPISYTKDTNTG